MRRLAASSLRRIEVTSFVNPKRVPQMADAEEVLAAVAGIPDVSFSGLVLNERGFHRAEACGVLAEVTFVMVVSETFSRRNQGGSVQDNMDVWARIAPRAAAASLLRSVTVAAAVGCPSKGEVSVGRVIDLAKAAADLGVEEISLADTIGVATPRNVEARFDALRQALPRMRLRAHFHNTRNTGYANVDAALRMGVDTLDASVAGLGGCPFAPEATGNVATEDVAYLLDRSGVDSAVSLPGIRTTALWGRGADRSTPAWPVRACQPLPGGIESCRVRIGSAGRTPFKDRGAAGCGPPR